MFNIIIGDNNINLRLGVLTLFSISQKTCTAIQTKNKSQLSYSTDRSANNRIWFQVVIDGVESQRLQSYIAFGVSLNSLKFNNNLKNANNFKNHC